MDSIDTDAKGFRRIEMLTGPSRRRRWLAAEKARIVAETFVPGAVVSEVARRWQVSSQQVFTWRREARAGDLVLPAEVMAGDESKFVPIVAEDVPTRQRDDAVGGQLSGPAKPSPEPCIEISLGDTMVRVARGTDCGWLAKVLRAVRASAA